MIVKTTGLKRLYRGSPSYLLPECPICKLSYAVNARTKKIVWHGGWYKPEIVPKPPFQSAWRLVPA